MAQFTVYRNKSPRSRTAYPLLVDVQSDLLDDLQTRVVIPMSKAAALLRKPVSHLTPAISVDGEDFLLLTPQIAAIARTDLGAAVTSLVSQRQVIIAAVDFLISGF